MLEQIVRINHAREFKIDISLRFERELAARKVCGKYAHRNVLRSQVRPLFGMEMTIASPSECWRARLPVPAHQSFSLTQATRRIEKFIYGVSLAVEEHL